MQKIYCFVSDLLFKTKIEETAKHLGKEIEFFSSEKDFFELKEFPSLIIFDLNNSQIDAIDFAKKLKANSKTNSIKLIGYLSHVQTELNKQARDAGFDQVLPRSLFSQKLAEILSQ
ncbi:MAG: response regulator [archaeon]|nr:response regulator [archaeon]